MFLYILNKKEKKEGCKHALEKDKCNLIRLLWDSALYGILFSKAREDREDEQNIFFTESVKMSLKLSEDNICRQTLWNDVYFQWRDCWCLWRKNVRVLFCVILWSHSVSTLLLYFLNSVWKWSWHFLKFIELSLNWGTNTSSKLLHLHSVCMHHMKAKLFKM